MDKQSKDYFYDEVCELLTDYENDEANGQDLYHMLVKIQRNWNELTTDEEVI